MLEYIDAVKRGLIDEYGFPENPEKRGCVLGVVPDGEYPMTIAGRRDYVRIQEGRIHCCNWKGKTLTFTSADLVRRAEEKFKDPKNTFCHNDYDAALDDALLSMKQELDDLREGVDEVMHTDPNCFTCPDYPDWDLLVERLK